MKKVKLHAKHEHEFLHNFTALQKSFKKMGVDKVIPVEQLIKADIKSNLLFARWFIMFYEANYKVSLCSIIFDS